MEKVTAIDRATADMIQKTCGEHLRLGALAALGLEIEKTRTTYDPRTNRIKLSFELRLSGGAPRIEVDYAAFAAQLGLPADGLGRKVLLSSGWFTIAGLVPSARKNPVIVKSVSTGKLYRMDYLYIRDYLEREDAKSGKDIREIDDRILRRLEETGEGAPGLERHEEVEG